MRASKFFYLLFIVILMLGCSQPDQTKELILIGHRGAMGLMPENTIPGFKKAVDLEVDGIELDVVISGDDQVVISHEPWFRHDICLTPEGDSIDKETQKEHRIYEMSYEQIAKYDCGSIKNPDFPDQETRSLSKPLLKEAVREIESYIVEKGNDPVTYFIEFKRKPEWDNELQPEPSKVVQLVHDELAGLEILDRVSVHSFNERMLQEFKKINSSIPQMYSIPKRNVDFRDNLAVLTYSPDVYFPHHTLVDSGLVNNVQNEEMLLIPWTVDEYDKMVKLRNLGVDGILSNYPNYFNKLRNN